MASTVHFIVSGIGPIAGVTVNFNSMIDYVYQAEPDLDWHERGSGSWRWRRQGMFSRRHDQGALSIIMYPVQGLQ